MTAFHTLAPRAAASTPAAASAPAARAAADDSISVLAAGTAATAASAPTAARDYPLARNEAEYARLAQQAAFWSPDAAALFDSAGVAEGDRVADLGCGTGLVAELLAERVGPRGAVRALDNDAGLVQATAQRTRTRAWLRFECGDAFASGWPAGALDAVHARFLAAPAGQLDELIGEMLRLVRPGGLVMLQEPIADTWDLPMAGAAWPRLLGLIRAGFMRRGGNFDAGRELAARLHAAGATHVHTRSVVHRLPAGHAYARLPLSFCDSLSALWRSTGLASADELDALRARVIAALDDGAAVATTFTLVQAWARR
jgi:SAM-dependent methyltransferase